MILKAVGINFTVICHIGIDITVHCVGRFEYCLLIVDVVQIPNLVQVFLIGLYEEREFALYVSSISNELRVPVRLALFGVLFHMLLI